MLQRIEAASISLTSIAVDGLIKSSSNGALFEFWASYGHDMVLPFASYMIIRAIDPSRAAIMYRLITVFSFCAIPEVLQGFNLYSGTFDWYDFIAFGIGVGLAAITERFIFRQSSQKIIQPGNNPAI